MARCPDCNRFVSIEMTDPELDIRLEQGEVGSNDCSLEGDVRLVQTCADCGAELAEANLEVSYAFEFDHDPNFDCREAELELENEEAENDDRFIGTGRYAKHFYVANIRATVKCPVCGNEKEIETNVEEQASCFDSLV